jgi:hypothetical protein
MENKLTVGGKSAQGMYGILPDGLLINNIWNSMVW